MNARVTDHFSIAEFDQPQRYGCPATDYPLQWLTSRLLPLCQQLELLRAALGGRTIRILSGYRTVRYNSACGGVPQSQHCAGRAADITVPGLEAHEVHAEVARLLSIGRLPLVRGVGRYPTFTHLDIRPSSTVVTWEGQRRAS